MFPAQGRQEWAPPAGGPFDLWVCHQTGAGEIRGRSQTSGVGLEFWLVFVWSMHEDFGLVSFQRVATASTFVRFCKMLASLEAGRPFPELIQQKEGLRLGKTPQSQSSAAVVTPRPLSSQ